MDINFKLRLPFFKRKIHINREWVRFGIMLLVILFTVFLTYWGSSRVMVLLLLLLLGVVGAVVLLRQPNLGFILIYIGGMFVPYSGPAGINAAVFFAALIVGVGLLEMLVVQRDLIELKSRVLLPFIMMLMISVIAFGMGQIPWFVFADQAPLSAQLGGLAIFVLSVGCSLVAAHFIQDITWLKRIVWMFVGLGAVYIFGRWMGLPISKLYQNGSTGSMFWTWLTAMAFAQFLYNTHLKKSNRVLLLGIILITFFVAFIRANDWKSGWVPPLVVILVLLGIKYKRFVIMAIPVASIVAVYFVGRLIASDEYSWGTRVDAWQIVLEISRVNPLFGLGFSNYYWYTPLYSIRGWFVNFNSHSQFVDLIAQVGIIGLLCFLWIFLEVIRLSWRLIQNKRMEGFAEAYTYAVLAGAIATLAAAFLGDWVLPFVYNVGLMGFRASILPWIFMGGLIAIERFTSEKFLAERKSFG